MKTLIRLLFLLAVCLSCNTNNNDDEANQADTVQKKAYVVHRDEGEILLDRLGRTNIIKVSPQTGAEHLTVGTQQIPKGSRIRVHRHEHTEEILFVHKGNGLALVEGDSIRIEEGSTVFIPPGTWHGVNTANDSLTILFVVSPQGLENLFRGTGSPPNTPLKTLTSEEMDSINAKADAWPKEK